MSLIIKLLSFYLRLVGGLILKGKLCGRGLPGRRALSRRFLPPFRGFCPRVLGGSPLLPLEGGILDPPSFKSLLRRGSSFPAFPFAFLWRRNLKHPDQHGIRRGLGEGGRTPYQFCFRYPLLFRRKLVIRRIIERQTNGMSGLGTTYLSIQAIAA